MWPVTAEDVFTGLADWRAAHPRATLQEIERTLDERLAVLRARMLEDLALTSRQADVQALAEEEGTATVLAEVQRLRAELEPVAQDAQAALVWTVVPTGAAGQAVVPVTGVLGQEVARRPARVREAQADRPEASGMQADHPAAPAQQASTLTRRYRPHKPGANHSWHHGSVERPRCA